MALNKETKLNQNNGCTATYLPSHKPSKQDEQDKLGTAGKVRINSLATLSYGSLHGLASVGRQAKT